jgi:hypothetical protein
MSEQLSDQRLAEIRELCDKATAGPWTYIYNQMGDGVYQVDQEGSVQTPIVYEENVSSDLLYDNYMFIAASRTIVPELLDEVWHLRAELRRSEAKSTERLGRAVIAEERLAQSVALADFERVVGEHNSLLADLDHLRAENARLRDALAKIHNYPGVDDELVDVAFAALTTTDPQVTGEEGEG